MTRFVQDCRFHSLGLSDLGFRAQGFQGLGFRVLATDSWYPARSGRLWAVSSEPNAAHGRWPRTAFEGMPPWPSILSAAVGFRVKREPRTAVQSCLLRM